ncbi:MAG: sodium:solute symporter family protein [Calditrichaeota bacterium]|nr:MAG: sodium:solute symporter family protein [Calditrichota bacterium]
MTISLHYLEIIPILAYLGALLWLGFRRRQRDASEEDFILGGRRLTLPAFVATLVTTWYGGILGVGEFTYLYGVSNWVVFGLPYYVYALLFAWLLAPRIQQARLLSIPDQFYNHFGRAGGALSAVFTFFMTLPAPYVLMVGLLIHFLSGWSLWLCIVLGTLGSVAYVLTGGFRAVIRTDGLQFVLMFGSFMIMLGVLVHRFGGLEYLQAHLPSLHLSWHGGNSPDYLAVWFFIALWTFIDPGFHQRCYAARSPGVARRGILMSVGFWAMFDFLTTATGLYARALLRDIDPVLSFPLLGHQVLPPLLSGIFLAGLLAIIMSTVDSLALLSAITIGHDLIGRWKQGASNSLTYTRIGLGVTAAVSALTAILIPSVIQIWYLIGTLFIPPMLLPVLACYFPRLNPGRLCVLATLTMGFLVSFAFLALSIAHSPSLENLRFVGQVQPMFPGLITSAVIFGIGIFLRRV